MNVVAAALVIAGAEFGTATVSVKLWVASGDTPLEAVIVSGYVPTVPASGVPERLAVLLPRFRNVTPAGSASGLSQRRDRYAGGRHHEIVQRASANVVLSALVIAGAWAAATSSVKLWVALGDTPLAAVIVNARRQAYPPLECRRAWRCRSHCPRRLRLWAAFRSRSRPASVSRWSLP